MATATASPSSWSTSADSGWATEWSNTSNAGVNDNAYATSTIVAAGEGAGTKYLVGTACGFAIPSGATITGITVTVRAKTSLGVDVRIYAEATKTGTPPAPSYSYEASLSSTSEVAVTPASATLFGTTWTADEINAATFGVAVFAEQSSDGTNVISIDQIEVTIAYTEAPAFRSYKSLCLTGAG